MSGGSAPKNTTTTTQPPAFQLPYLQDVMRQAQQQYQGQLPSYFPGNPVAPIDPNTVAGSSGLAGFGGSQYNQGVLGAAQGAQQNLSNASNPFSNPVLGLGYSLTPSSYQAILAAQQQSGVNLQPSVEQARQYIANPQTAPVGATPTEGYSSGTSPLGTVNRLQSQTTQVTPGTSTPTAAESLAGQTNPAGAINSQLNLTPGSSPYINELVQRSLVANTRNFNQSVLPQISNNSEVAGGYGGSRQGVAQGIATQGLNDANAQIAAGIYSNQYNQDLQRQLQAASLATSAAATGGAQELQRTAQDRGFGLDVAQLGQQDLNRQLQAAGLGGNLALSGDQLALQRQQSNNQLGLNLGGFDLQRAGLGLQLGTAEQQFLQNQISQGLQGSQLGLGTLQSGYQSGLDAGARNLALSPQTQQLGLTGAQSQLAAGDINRTFEQQQIDAEMQRYFYNQQQPIDALQRYANTVYGGSGGGGSVTAPATGGSGGVAGALGGAAVGASALAALQSSGVWGTTAAGLAATPPGWAAGAIIGLGALAGLFA